MATTTAAPEWADLYVPQASSPERDTASSERPIYCCANARCPPRSSEKEPPPQRGCRAWKTLSETARFCSQSSSLNNDTETPKMALVNSFGV